MKKLMLVLIMLAFSLPSWARETVAFKNSTYVVQGDLIGKSAEAVWIQTGAGVYRIPFAVMDEKDGQRLVKVADFDLGKGEVKTYQGVLNLNKPSRDGTDRTYYWINAGMTRIELMPPGRAEKDEWRNMVGRFVEAKGVWQAGEYLESSGRLISSPAVFQVESLMIILTEKEKKLKAASEGN